MSNVSEMNEEERNGDIFYFGFCGAMVSAV